MRNQTPVRQRRFPWFGPVRHPKLLDEVHLRDSIELERLRCDRGGPPFAIIELDSITRNGKTGFPDSLLEDIQSRIRHLDQFGHLNAGLALLLPNTDLNGARRLANRLNDPEDRDLALLRCRISVYPMDADRLMKQPAPTWKRGLDLMGSSAMLFLLSPVLGLCVLYLQLRDPGPVLFHQIRIGHLGRPFRMYKLRTMRQHADQGIHQRHLQTLIQGDLPMRKLDQTGDQRLIPGSTLLRKLGIDELAQLLNVLRGDMSLVGPRPCLPYEAEGFQQWQRARFDVRPGLTGLWQVNGKNRTTFREMISLDIRYSRALMPWQDLSILLRTIPAVIDYARHDP